jgi:hypothetical protein
MNINRIIFNKVMYYENKVEYEQAKTTGAETKSLLLSVYVE